MDNFSDCLDFRCCEIISWQLSAPHLQIYKTKRIKLYKKKNRKWIHCAGNISLAIIENVLLWRILSLWKDFKPIIFWNADSYVYIKKKEVAVGNICSHLTCKTGGLKLGLKGLFENPI